MPEDVPGDLAILFALRGEARPLLRDLPIQEAVSAPCKARFCRGPRTLLVLETGVGRERMDRALDWLLGKPLVRNAPYIPKLVISAGISGALREDLNLGDVVVATEVIGPDGACHAVTWPGNGEAPLLPHLRRGRLLTVDRLIADPADKRALGVRHDAIAVDMETATVGRRCSRVGIPFACIRGISDDAHTALSPEVDYIIDNGRVSLRRLTGSLLRRPALAAELWRLARNTRLAAEQLGKTLTELLLLTTREC
jgi:hypothetical protein